MILHITIYGREHRRLIKEVLVERRHLGSSLGRQIAGVFGLLHLHQLTHLHLLSIGLRPANAILGQDLITLIASARCVHAFVSPSVDVFPEYVLRFHILAFSLSRIVHFTLVY